MTMLAILIGYTLERFLNNIDHYRTYQWFNQFIDWSQTRLRSVTWLNDTLSVLMVLLLPVFAVAYLHHLMTGTSQILDFLFSIIVLLYCFGPKDFHVSARLFIDAREHDDQTKAHEHATHILGESMPENDSQLFYAISKTILVATNERLLAIFFWFALLGPMGAILYRLAHVMLRHLTDEQKNSDGQQDGLSPDNGLLNITRLLFAILNYIPSHLTAFCFAIMGSFIDAIHEWRSCRSFDPLNPDDCDSMLVRTGLGSLRMDANSVAFDQSSLKAILDMSWRTTLAWLTLVALITMAGWAT